MSLALTRHDLEAMARPRFADKYLVWLGVLLTGYALFGRGFAYLGVPPVFVGEVMLGLGILVLLTTSGWERILQSSQALLIFPLVIWCAIQTIPYIKTYRVDALRDAALWGYSAFAFIAGGILLARPERLPRLIRFYRKFALIFLIVMPLLMAVRLALPGFNPQLSPGNPFLFSARRGSMMVHLATILVFMDTGFVQRARWLPLIVMPGLFVFGSNRAGMVAFAGTMIVAMLLGGIRKVTAGVATVLVLGIVCLVLFGDYITLPGPRGEPMKGTMFLEKIESISGKSDVARWGNTTDWRKNWWTDIFNYTVRGKYFWTGKGFGVNLATDDGYQIGEDEKTIRSPHNGHMTFLARAGVPGFALWAILNTFWIGAILRSYWRSRQQPDVPAWPALFLVLIAYWTAAMAQTAFDVELEGPMGGIWFWVVFGTGIAALRIYETNPQVLRDVLQAPSPENEPDSRSTLAATRRVARRLG